MNKYSKKHNWLMLILLVFAGQTISVPLLNHHDCESEHSSVVSSDHTMMNHDMGLMPDHDMSMMEMNLDKAMECCADDCQCSDGVCVSTVYFSIHEKGLQFSIENNVIFQVVSFKTIQRISSLYRPPILS